MAQVLGRLLGISDTILGLTILSWGGSLGGTLVAARPGVPVACEFGADEPVAVPRLIRPVQT